MCASQVEIATLLVLTLTLFVLIIYTYYTFKLHTASQDQTNELAKQRKLSVMPSLLHEIESVGINERRMHLRNIGNGVAVNVRVDRIIIDGINNLHYMAEAIDFVEPRQAKPVTVQSYISNEQLDSLMDMLLHLEPGDESTSYTIQIDFQDIEGRQYRQLNRVEKGIYMHGSVEAT